MADPGQAYQKVIDKLIQARPEQQLTLPIDVNTKLTLELYQEYVLFTASRGQRFQRIWYNPFVSFGILTPILAFCILLSQGNAWVLAASLVLFIYVVWSILSVKLKPRREFRKNTIAQTSQIRFRFYENNLTVEVLSPDINSTMNLKYNVLHQVSETNTAFYLFLNKRMAHILPKSDMTIGMANELQSFLAKQMVKKYKRFEW